MQVLQSWLTGMAVAWEGAGMLVEPGRVQVIAEPGMVRGDIAEHGRARAGCEGCSGLWCVVREINKNFWGWFGLYT